MSMAFFLVAARRVTMTIHQIGYQVLINVLAVITIIKRPVTTKTILWQKLFFGLKVA